MAATRARWCPTWTCGAADRASDAALLDRLALFAVRRWSLIAADTPDDGLWLDLTEGSPIRDRDIATQYIRLILYVTGIADVTVVGGDGAKVVDLGEQTMGGFIERVEPEMGRAAAA